MKTASDRRQAGGNRARTAGLAALLLLAASCAHRTTAGEPAASAPLPQSSDGVYHRIRAGETLWRIATVYGISPERLARENALDAHQPLEVGSILFIPGYRRELTIPLPPSPLPSPAELERARTQARLAPRPAPQAESVGEVSASPAPPPRGLSASPPSPSSSGRTPALLWPVRGVLFSPFGRRPRDKHEGIDLAAPEGTPVVAAAAGIVLFAGTQRGYGQIILVRHSDELITVYAHNEKNLVREGQRVDRGQPIARVGRTGNATGPHLHFEVRVKAIAHDPMLYLR